VCSLEPLRNSSGTPQVVQACLSTGSLAPPSAAVPGDGAGEADGVAPADPQTLAQQAAAVLDLPTPDLHLNPEGDQVVRLPAWLWIAADQWEPRRVSASAGPVTTTVTATPARVTWDMGNGDEVQCDGPGTPYQPRYAGRPEATDCRYTYRRSSAGQPGEVYEVTATVHWELAWSATGAAGGGDLGTVPMSTTQPARVTQIQALVQ
jgi:hypothetical protein